MYGLSGNILQCMLHSWTQDLCPWPSKVNTEPTVSNNITGKTKQVRVGRVCSYQMRPDHLVKSLTLAGNKTRVGDSCFQTVRLDIPPLEGLWSPLPLICLPLRWNVKMPTLNSFPCAWAAKLWWSPGLKSSSFSATCPCVVSVQRSLDLGP